MYGQLMGRISFAIIVSGLVLCGCSSSETARRPALSGEVKVSRSLVASVRSEPRTFNRLVAIESTSVLVSSLTQAALVRINNATDQVEPWLAESWSRTSDGLSYEFRLRRDVQFSDGEPFTAHDVVFSFRALYDESTGSALADALRVNGEPLDVVAVDDYTVRVTYPSRFGPGVRVLSSLPVLPRHLLETVLEEGSLSDSWGVTTPPAEIAGLGPFRLTSYSPGERLVFVRNPFYWRQGPAGESLPYLDRLTLEIVPSQDAEFLRLEAGEIDLLQTEIRADDYPTLSQAAEDGKVQLVDLGVALDADFLVFNLKPSAMSDDPRRSWLQAANFRRAVAHAVDREEFADAVYLGLGVPVHGPVSESNNKWYSPDVAVYAHDMAEARRLLELLDLVDRDSDGYVEDADGLPVGFTLLVQSGHSIRERAATVIQEDLRKVGIQVNVVQLELGLLIERLSQMAFDAAYVGFQATDTDPAANLDLWISSSRMHFWNPSQPEPETQWEAQIDEKMKAQVAVGDEMERKHLFDEVQQIFAEHIPAVYFAAPRVIVAMSPRVLNAQPALLRPHVLWSADTLDAVQRDSP